MQILNILARGATLTVAALLILANTPAHAQITQSVTTTVTPVVGAAPDAGPAPVTEPAPLATAPAPTTTAATDPAMTASTVPMVSGGIGDDGLAHMKSLESQYNLKLLFTEHNGMYLANVHVQLDDKSGKTVATTVATGPILLLTLPAGTYKVTASESGETHAANVTVTGKSLASYVLRFRTEDTQKSN